MFVAHDEQLGRDVALKVLLPEHSSSPEILQRFFHEARAAAAIQHPGIVMIFEYGRIEGTGTSADGSAFIAMELLSGESLAARLRRPPPLATGEVLSITRQIAAALGAAHGEDIVHRDLKPDNVFLVPDEDAIGGFRVKVLDFGIAKLQGAGATGHGHTRTMMVFGTPPYMSPEQCRSSARIDHRSDIYALGCILFEMLCGRPPFVGEPGELIALHQLQPPPAPSSLAPIDPGLEALVLQMLAKKPEDRPQTMDDVRAALERHRTRELAAQAAPRPSSPPFAAPSPPPVSAPPHAPPPVSARPATSEPHMQTTLIAAAGSRPTQSDPGDGRGRKRLGITIAAVGGIAVVAALVALGASGGRGDAATGAAPTPGLRPETEATDPITKTDKPPQPLFLDDFERDQLGPRYRPSGPGWSMQDGVLHARKIRGYTAWLDQPLPADARIAFNVWGDERSAIIVQLWGDVRSQQVGYFLYLHESGAEMLRPLTATGTALRVNRTDVSLEPGRRYRFEVERRGGRIEWRSSDRTGPILVLEDRSPVPPEPDAYLGLSGIGTIHFDNVEITPLAPLPDATPVTYGPPTEVEPDPPYWIRIVPPTPPVVLGVAAAHPPEVSGFRPARGVTSPTQPYWMLAQEVDATMLAWLGSAGASWKGVNGPARGVPYDLARQLCERLDGHLPTEAEWELAARGAAMRPYPWGSDPTPPASGDVTPEGVRGLLTPPREWVSDTWRNDLPCPADTPSCEAYFTSDGKEIGVLRGGAARDRTGSFPPFAAAARERLCRSGGCTKAAAPHLRDVGFRCVRRD